MREMGPVKEYYATKKVSSKNSIASEAEALKQKKNYSSENSIMKLRTLVVSRRASFPDMETDVMREMGPVR
jgi:hypothetical protein